MTPFPSVDESFARLHQAGWSIGETGGAGFWFVTGTNGRRSIMQPDRIEPTQEMVAFFERRTNEHIERVRRCLMLLARVTPHGEQLLERAELHDASKFGATEGIPYVWLTEYHRRRRNGEPFEYPQGTVERVKWAIHHHVTSNRHHPEFHADPNDMSEVDLIEMVGRQSVMQ